MGVDGIRSGVAHGLIRTATFSAMSKPVGPYTPAVRAGDFLITSGQIGIADGAVVEGGLEAQANQALANLVGLLEANGAAVSDVVKTTVFLTDMANYAAMNEIYIGTFGTDNPPARSAVAVAALPLGALIEIEAMAHLPAG